MKKIYICILPPGKRKSGRENVETLPFEFHIVRFGNMLMAANPFELFLDYGTSIVSCPIGSAGGAELVEKILEVINKMFE